MRLPLVLLLHFVAYKHGSAFLELKIPDNKYALDIDLFERVLDPELCDDQIKYIVQNDTSLLIELLDAGIRTPNGVLTGNVVNLGNYYQCLGINQQIPNSIVEGKYCMIRVPLEQNLQLPSFAPISELNGYELPWRELNANTTRIKPHLLQRIKEYNAKKLGIQALIGSNEDKRVADTQFAALTLNLATCIPKACSPQKALTSIFAVDVQFEEVFCRLPNDKPWVSADYVALVIFSLIGLVTILSTGYDLHYHKYLNADPKNVNKLYQSFSVYTNTRRLITYTPVPDAIECLDGIRSFAMMWVIIGHTFASQISSGIIANVLDGLTWMSSLSSLWITAAPITVDTFFFLSGLLIVYSTAGKFTGMKLLKNLHLFYLNRLLRMFPVLAAMILIQASFLNWFTDGPYWTVTMLNTHRCRVFWWSTLFHIQNFINPLEVCIPPTWYLAIDVQLYMVSPVVLFWVLGAKRKIAWIALVCSFLAILVSATSFNFAMNFPSAPGSPSRPEDEDDYIKLFYVNPLTRGSPFFVGMLFGYLMHLCRGKKLDLQKGIVILLWVCTTVTAGLIVYAANPPMQLDWDNQLADNFINSFMRPAWAAAIGWLVFACHHGYGGPVNWVLSLHMWKLLSRLSYAMYIVHYPLLFLFNAMEVAPIYFTVTFSLFKFLLDFVASGVVAFIMTIFIDAPCSALVKHFLGGGPKTQQARNEEFAQDAVTRKVLSDKGNSHALDEDQMKRNA